MNLTLIFGCQYSLFNDDSCLQNSEKNSKDLLRNQKIKIQKCGFWYHFMGAAILDFDTEVSSVGITNFRYRYIAKKISWKPDISVALSNTPVSALRWRHLVYWGSPEAWAHHNGRRGANASFLLVNDRWPMTYDLFHCMHTLHALFEAAAGAT